MSICLSEIGANTLQKNELKALREGLITEFNAVFGNQALYNYYLGKKKVASTGKDGKPKKTYEDFNPHFEHEVLADDLNLRFMNLHPILQAYFMAYALDKTTTAKRYTELKQELKSEFSEQAKLEMLVKDAGLTEDQEQDVFDKLETVADRMIKDFGYSEPHAA